MSLLCCMLLFPTFDSNQSLVEFFQEYRSSWLDYLKKCQGLQCYRNVIEKRDSKVHEMLQTLVFYHPDGLLQVGRRFTPNELHKIRAGALLLRKKNGQFEQFRFLSQLIEDADMNELSPEYLRKKHQWILTSEAIVNPKALDLHEFSLHDRVRGGVLLDGHVMGLSAAFFLDWISQETIKVDKFIRTNNTAVIEFSIPVKKSTEVIKQGVIRLEKLSHWLLNSIDLVFEEDKLFGDVEGWYYRTGKVKTEYLKIGNLDVPSSRLCECIIKDKEGKDHRAEFDITYTVSKIQDNWVFNLPTFGIPERSVKPDLPAPIATVDSSSVENIPLWAWLTAFAVILLVVGLLLRRSPKAKRA